MIRIPMVIASGQTDGVFKDLRKALGESGISIDQLGSHCICGFETPNGTFEPTTLTLQFASPDPTDDTVHNASAIKSHPGTATTVAAGQVVPVALSLFPMLYEFARLVANSAPAADRTVYLLLRRI